LSRYTRKNKRCRILKEEDGLLMSNITALAMDCEKLWIGFGRGEFRGVGYLDVSTRHFTGLRTELDLKRVTDRFFAALAMQSEAPRSKIDAVCPMTTGDLWLLGEDRALRHYSVASRRWRVIRGRPPTNLSSLAAVSNCVAIGGQPLQWS
jgi:hypothetical protein